MVLNRPIFLIPSLVIFALLTSSVSHAFSNNNVRVDRFKWMKAQTEHFDIHYDKADEKWVPRLALYLEKAWKSVGDRLNFEVKERTPFFFYSNHNKFEQSNIVRIGEGTGGVTEAFKNRFLIFNDGSETWLKHVIEHEFAHVVQFNVLYGGFWKSVRLLKSPFYPLWVMEGMAEWSTQPIDAPVGEMMIRDSVYHGYRIPIPELQGFNHLKPNQVTLAYKTGTMAMTFLEDEYGKGTVGRLLAKMEEHFDISSALETMLGLGVHRMDFRFEEWLKDRYRPIFKEAKTPDYYGDQLTFSDGLPQANHSPVFSPDGSVMYYFSDRGGPTQLYVYERRSKKNKPLIGLKWSKFENIHSRGRSLSISRDGRWLAFSAEKKQRDFLFLYDLKKEKLKRVKLPFDQIRSPVFSPVSNDLVCVGMENGFNDLYLVSRKGKIIKRLTSNPQDERDPVFNSTGEYVVYSGEVLNETRSDPAGRDLFKVQIQDKSIRRLTYLPGAVVEPEVLPDGSILFIRDRNEKGQFGFNLFHMDASGTEFSQLTNLVGGAFAPRYHDGLRNLFIIAFNNGERHVYLWTHPKGIPEKKTQLASKSQSSGPSPTDQEYFEQAWGDPPRKKASAAVTRALQAWPDSSDSSLLLRSPQPLRTRLSTDLFLPFFFYSTQDGLVAADVWQFSDYLGNHSIQQQLQYASDNDFVDLALFYTYARFRPQFTIGFRNQQFFRDFGQTHQRRDLDGVALVSYPLDRINSVNFGVGASDEKETFLDDSDVDTEIRERYLLAGLSHDTVTGRYLVPTKGRRISLFYQQSEKEFGGNQQFKSGGAEGVQYFPLPRESTLASRLFYGRSVGSTPQVFRLGGVDRIRAVNRSGEAHKKENVVFGSAELRMRMKYLNARTKFLFPDFFFKAAYLILFNDVGYGWDNRTERQAFAREKLINASGVGISWPTFILQTFQINFTVQWARRTDNGSDVWYITLGPSY